MAFHAAVDSLSSFSAGAAVPPLAAPPPAAAAAPVRAAKARRARKATVRSHDLGAVAVLLSSGRAFDLADGIDSHSAPALVASLKAMYLIARDRALGLCAARARLGLGSAPMPVAPASLDARHADTSVTSSVSGSPVSGADRVRHCRARKVARVAFVLAGIAAHHAAIAALDAFSAAHAL